MKTFAIPQIKNFPDGELCTKHGPDHLGHTNSRIWYNGKTNKPINMEHIITFFDDMSEQERVKYPVIRFARTLHANDSPLAWFYPPTEEGKARRNADLTFLKNNFGTRCPQHIPQAVR